MSTTTTVSKDNAAEPQNRIHKLNLSSASMGSHREGDCKNHGMSIPAMRRVFQDTQKKNENITSHNNNFILTAEVTPFKAFMLGGKFLF